MSVLRTPMQFGPHQAHAVPASRTDDGPLHFRSGPPDLAEPRRDHNDALDALLAALIDHLGNGRGRHDNEGEIDRIRDLTDGGIGLDGVDERGVRIDGIDRSGEPPHEQVAQEPAPDRPVVATGTDDRHRGRDTESA